MGAWTLWERRREAQLPAEALADPAKA
jgi:hypothetical protein